MPFLIDASDLSGTASVRGQIRPDHLSYLDSQLRLLLAAGAKLSDDGKTPQGSFYLLDVEDRAAAQEFVDGDPYTRTGVFGPITMTRVRRGFFDHARVQPKS